MTRCETCGKPCQHRFCGFDCTVLHHTRSITDHGECVAHRNKIVFEAEDIKLLELAGLCLVDGPCSISGEPEVIRYKAETVHYTTEYRSARQVKRPNHEYINPKYYKPCEGRQPHNRLRGGQYSLGGADV